MAPDTRYTGSVDTSNGAPPIVIGTAGNKIRIETGSDENELSLGDAHRLIARLTEALNEATDWEISHPIEDDNA